MIKPCGKNIWVAHQPLKFLSLQIGTRMTVIDYSGEGDLFIHSPIRLSEELRQELEQLGEVRFVVAPNLFHHLFIADFREKYPNAKFVCSPGLEKKRKDFDFHQVLQKGQSFPWSESILFQFVEGCPALNETVFFHKPTKSLIVTDLGLHICEDSPFLTRVVFKMMGIYKKYGWSKMEKKLFIKSPESFKLSVEKIINWDFDRILLPHGRIVEKGGKGVFQTAFL